MALRAIGCTVVSLSRVGDGCPDLLVGFRGKTTLIEVKNPYGRDEVNELQRDWHGRWRGAPVAVVRSPDEAILVVTGHGSADS